MGFCILNFNKSPFWGAGGRGRLGLPCQGSLAGSQHSTQPSCYAALADYFYFLNTMQRFQQALDTVMF